LSDTALTDTATLGVTVAPTPAIYIIASMVNAGTASTEVHGDNYAVDPTEAIIKLTLYADVNKIPVSEVTDGAVSISGVEIDFNFVNWSEFEIIDYNDTANGWGIADAGYDTKSVVDTDHTWTTYDDGSTGALNKMVVAATKTTGTPPNKTLVDKVSSAPATDRPETMELGSIYLNPLDSLTEVNFSYGSSTSIVVTNSATDNYVQDVISMNVDTTLIDAKVQVSSSKFLDNITLDYYNNGVDTGVSTLVEDGGIKIEQLVDFDTIKLSASNAYTDNLNILDLYGVLDKIGQTIDTTEEHAADLDNNGSINILDLYDVLDRIGQRPQTFDLIDSNGDRVTQLDPNATGDAPTWIIVANGDVNQSGSFAADYVVTSDLV